MLNRLLAYQHGILNVLKNSLRENYDVVLKESAQKNVVNVMTNEFPAGIGKKTYDSCIFIEQEGDEYGISKSFGEMLKNQEFYAIVKELIQFGIDRYKTYFSKRYQDTDFVLY